MPLRAPHSSLLLLLYLHIYHRNKAALFREYTSNHMWSKDSAVIQQLGYRLANLGLNPSRGKSFFSFPKHPHQLWGPPSLLHIQTPEVFPMVKCPGHEVDHSAPSRAEVKNQHSQASTPLYASHCRQGQFHLPLHL